MSRKKTSLFGVIIGIATKLPYWISLLIAIVSYFVLHAYAASELQPIVEPGKVTMPDMSGMLFRGLATALQYMIPMMFVLGSLNRAIKSFQGKGLSQRYMSSRSAETSLNGSLSPLKPTDDMNWQQFELLVGQAFRSQGYSVVDGGDFGADGGVDVFLSKGGLKYYVQCKHWKTRKVGVTVVRELYGVIAGAGIEGGFIVTSGSFTKDAIAFAENKAIDLIDKDFLDELLLGIREPLINIAVEDAVSEPEEPNCPRCSSTMVKRKARQGARAGQKFWGCSHYPKCRGIVNI